MFKKGLRGHYPSLWYRFKYNFSKGLKSIKNNFWTWKLKLTTESLLGTIFFWSHLTNESLFPNNDISLLPLSEYYWIERFLLQEGYLKDSIVIGGVAPFVIEAEHPKGYSIYFRSRGCTSLKVYTGNYEDTWENKELFLADIDIPGEYIFDESEAFQIFYYHYNDLKDLLVE